MTYFFRITFLLLMTSLITACSTGDGTPTGPPDFVGSLDGFQYEIHDVYEAPPTANWKGPRILANVYNVGQTTFLGTKFVLDLLDSNGRVLKSYDTYIPTDIVPPASSSPIWFGIEDAPAWDSLNIYASDVGMQAGDWMDIAELSVSPRAGSGQQCDVLTVTNDSNQDVQFAYVIERHFDEEGRMNNVFVLGANGGQLTNNGRVDVACFNHFSLSPAQWEVEAIGWGNR